MLFDPLKALGLKHANTFYSLSPAQAPADKQILNCCNRPLQPALRLSYSRKKQIVSHLCHFLEAAVTCFIIDYVSLGSRMWPTKWCRTSWTKSIFTRLGLCYDGHFSGQLNHRRFEMGGKITFDKYGEYIRKVLHLKEKIHINGFFWIKVGLDFWHWPVQTTGHISTV